MDDIKAHVLNIKCFQDNVYLEKYISLIKNAQKNNINNNDNSVIYECHHIIPKCVYRYLNIDIDDSDNNKVILKFSEHVLAHYYLCLFTTEPILKSKLAYAFFMLSSFNKIPEETLLLEQLNKYEELRNIMLKQKHDEMIGNQHAKGNVLSKETKRKMSESRMGHITSKTTKEKISISHKGKRWINKNEEYKQVSNEVLQEYLNDGWSLGGKSLSEQQIKLLISINTGAKRTEETKQKIRNAKLGKQTWNKGIPMSNEAKKKLSKIKTGSRWINNGETEKMITKDEELPDGFDFGRLKKINKILKDDDSK